MVTREHSAFVDGASPDDPVLHRLSIGRDLGILGIELASRRRLRINGAVERISADEIGVLVRESVPNCPKYIQRRHPHDLSTAPSSHAPSAGGRTVDEERRVLLEGADTAFVGSLHLARGGCLAPGRSTRIHQVVDATTLRVPDYREQHVHDARQLRGRFTREPGRTRFRRRLSSPSRLRTPPFQGG
jgi:hypothetical protein